MDLSVMHIASRIIQATPVAPGIAIGRVKLLHDSGFGNVPVTGIDASRVDSELTRFREALELTRKQIQDLRERLKAGLNEHEAGIFDAHLLLVEDRTMVAEIEHNISVSLHGAEYAVHLAVEKFAAAFAAVPDEYLQERALDVRDVGARIIGNLSEKVPAAPEYDEPRIVVAPTLTPSETVAMPRERVLAFAVETGSATSHTAILARSLRIPAVVGMPREILESLTVADKLIVDGFSGKVIVNPDNATLDAYRLKSREAQKIYRQLSAENALKPMTTDGFVVELVANVDADDDYAAVRRAGAGGIGLFRTEFIFMDPGRLPDEDEQFEIYKKLLISAGNDLVTIRTLDIGGDKLCSGILRSEERNPFLGLRGIRLCLRERRDIFITQLRALMRAGVHGNLQIMIPMVSCMDEVLETKAIIADIQKSLTAENVPFAANLPLGVMIETPAAAMIAGALARQSAFFSIGTNDLIQYTLATDRSNERVGHLYRPGHPAVLRMIRETVRAARDNNIPVTVCGQTAEDMTMTPLLIGLGVNELSMSVGAMPLVRRTIRQLAMRECAALAEKALGCESSEQVLRLSREIIRRCVPELADM